MAKIRNQHHEQDGPPDAHVPRRPQDKSLVDSKEEVHIRQLGHGDRRAERQGRRVRRGRHAIKQRQVVTLVEVVEVGAHQGRNGLQKQEKEAVDEGEAEALALSGHYGLTGWCDGGGEVWYSVLSYSKSKFLTFKVGNCATG